jgi:hypothetical protein
MGFQAIRPVRAAALAAVLLVGGALTGGVAPAQAQGYPHCYYPYYNPYYCGYYAGYYPYYGYPYYGYPGFRYNVGFGPRFFGFHGFRGGGFRR